MIESTTRTIDEAYSSATNAQSLALTPADGPRCDADLLIAMGWSRSRVGAALIRLHSEFDGAERLRPVTKQAIESIALTLPRIEGSKLDKATGAMVPVKSVDTKSAARLAGEWQMHEAKLLLGKLKTLPQVRHQLVMQAEYWGFEDAEKVAVATLSWWLGHICPCCGGTKFEMVAGTNRQSAKTCRVCRGSGEAPLLYGRAGTRMLGYINDCIDSARKSIRGSLRPNAK